MAKVFQEKSQDMDAIQLQELSFQPEPQFVATTAGTTAVVVAPAAVTLAGKLTVVGTAILATDVVTEKIGENLAKSKGNKESEAGAESSKPENKSPEGAGRKGALNEAKRKNGVPTSQQPEEQTPNYDKRGNKQPGRQYKYRDSKGNPVNSRDDSQGHTYPDNPSQNRGPHFNDEVGNHYDY